MPRHPLGSPSCPGASTDPSPLHPGLQSHRLSPQHPFSHQQSLQMSRICWLTKVSTFPRSRCDPEALAAKNLPLEGLAGPVRPVTIRPPAPDTPGIRAGRGRLGATLLPTTLPRSSVTNRLWWEMGGGSESSGTELGVSRRKLHPQFSQDEALVGSMQRREV